MNKELKKYNDACEALKDSFIESLYPDEEYQERILNDEGYWIGDTIGGVYNWWDYFVNIDNMADYFRYEYTPGEFDDWYDQCINKRTGGLNMRTFKLGLPKPEKGEMPIFDMSDNI